MKIPQISLNVKFLNQVFELKLVLYCICIEPLWRKPTP